MLTVIVRPYPLYPYHGGKQELTSNNPRAFYIMPIYSSQSHSRPNMTKKKKIDALQEQLPTNNKWVLVYKCPISFSSGRLTLR